MQIHGVFFFTTDIVLTTERPGGRDVVSQFRHVTRLVETEEHSKRNLKYFR